MHDDVSGALPGSTGEHRLQADTGTGPRARAFYRDQVLDHLNEAMAQFIGRMEMVFLATSDACGHCDASFRAGDPGFVRVLDAHRLVWPEYRGNGVMASAGNILENPHVGLVFMDFFESTVGLHVNGRAQLVEPRELAQDPSAAAIVAAQMAAAGGRHPDRWIAVAAGEA